MSVDSPIDALRFMGDTGIIPGSTFVMHIPFLEVIFIPLSALRSSPNDTRSSESKK